MENNIVRTVVGGALQNALYLDLPHAFQENSTLNEKFGIQAGVYPASDDTPTVRYFGVGNGGHGLQIGAAGIPKPRNYQKEPDMLALFKHLPFVLRESDNDLSPGMRAKYALRRQEQHNGVNYWAYYLRRIDFTGVSVQAQYKTVQEDGTVITTPFVPTSANLNPTPRELTEEGVNVVSGDYLRAVATIDLVFTPEDVSELLNVANIIYSDPELAIVSEIAYCSGVDKVVQVPGQGSSNFNFNEAIGVQVCAHQQTFYAMQTVTEGFTITVDVGNNEPLYKLVTG